MLTHLPHAAGLLSVASCCVSASRGHACPCWLLRSLDCRGLASPPAEPLTRAPAMATAAPPAPLRCVVERGEKEKGVWEKFQGPVCKKTLDLRVYL